VSYYKTIIIAEKAWLVQLTKNSSWSNGSQTILTGMLPNVAFIEKRIRDGHLTNITYKQAGKDRQCIPPDRRGFKICEKLIYLRWSKGHMWDNVTVLEEHTSGTPHKVGTPLENSGTPWDVRYTRLTSTVLNLTLL